MRVCMHACERPHAPSNWRSCNPCASCASSNSCGTRDPMADATIPSFGKVMSEAGASEFALLACEFDYAVRALRRRFEYDGLLMRIRGAANYARVCPGDE